MAIFLSHSGIQKDFVHILYHELDRAHHTCFFDQDNVDSLSKTDILPDKILQSINTCKLGVVVLSEDFITSSWPMAELENLTNANKKIYPIFYGLEPKHLVDEAKLQQWEKKWNQFNKDKTVEGLPFDIRKWRNCLPFDIRTCLPFEVCEEDKAVVVRLPFDIRKWRNCLAKVRSTAGSKFNPAHNNAYPFIRDELVPAICEICPPRAIFFANDNSIKGRQRIAQEIEDKFQNLKKATQNQENPRQKNFVLGLYGMAGGGKTTLCKTMVDYYNERGYSGASCLFDLPTEEVECDALVPKLKSALKRLTNAREQILSEIEHFDQGITTLEQRVKGKDFFLAIDNVWKWSKVHVKKILDAILNQREKHEWDTNKAIKVIITTRDRKLLEYLLNIEGIQKDITHVPTINNQEALEFMKTHMKCNVDHHETMLEAIANGCFFNGSCNPLVLNIMAKKVEQYEVTNVERVLKDCMHQLKGQQLPNDDEDMDEQVISVTTNVYENLNKHLQNLFMNTVILYKVFYYSEQFNGNSRILFSWLRMLADFENEEDTLSKLKELESHGMLRMTFKSHEEALDLDMDLGTHDLLDVNIEVEIHDLFIEVGKRAAINSKCYLLSHRLDQPQDLSQVSVVLVSFLVLVSKMSGLIVDFKSKLRQCSTYPLKLLVVQHSSLLQSSDKILNLRDHIGSTLRILFLSCDGMHEITGLRSAPNLLFLHLGDCEYLREIKDINHLHKLQELHVNQSDIYWSKLSLRETKLVVPNLASCTNLRRLTLRFCTTLKDLAQLGCPPSLQVLVLSRCYNLVNLEGLEILKSIQLIHLSGCNIEEFPNVELPKLKKLLLRGCSKLRRVMAGVDDWYSHLSSLQVLDLSESGSEEGEEELRLGRRVLSALRVLNTGYFTFKEEDKLNPNMEELSIRVNMESAEALKASFAVLKLKRLQIEVRGSTGDQSGFDEFLWPRNLQKLMLTMTATLLLNNLASVSNTLSGLGLLSCSSEAIASLPTLLTLEGLTISRSSSMQILSIEASLPELTALFISECSMKVLRIAAPFPKLTHLAIRKCESLESIQNLSSLTQLKLLDLKGCQSLNLTLQEITCLTNLDYLDLRDCKLQNGKVENLKAYLPDCQIKY